MHRNELSKVWIVMLAVVVSVALLGLGANFASAKTTLTVYTAVEADDLKKYAVRLQ